MNESCHTVLTKVPRAHCQYVMPHRWMSQWHTVSTKRLAHCLDKTCHYGVATVSRLLKIICLFCKRALQKRWYSAKETYNFKEPTNRSHRIAHCRDVMPHRWHRWMSQLHTVSTKRLAHCLHVTNSATGSNKSCRTDEWVTLSWQKAAQLTLSWQSCVTHSVLSCSVLRHTRHTVWTHCLCTLSWRTVSWRTVFTKCHDPFSLVI